MSRLEEIKDEAYKEKYKHQENGEVTERYLYKLTEKDFEWIVNRVEELEEERERWQSGRNIAVSTKLELERYKQALEEIVNIDGYFISKNIEFMPELAYEFVDRIARKALEGEQ